MKTIDIYGDNRFEQYTNVRVGCRGIVMHKDKILMTYEVNTDQWFIPGGGLEADESEMKRGAYLREYKALLSYVER
ncbi:MAG: hypothetical protein IJ326_08295 [Lachnospiraceae bacterium]|nr:hypothetical protein [Lachnospiraceae bacterium]